MRKSITHEFLSSSEERCFSERRHQLARNAVTRHDATEILINREVEARYNHVYSDRIEGEMKATSQKSSGRCWMFAALNVMRMGTVKKYKLEGRDFEFSQSYLFFFDKLEKSNYFLENIVDTVSEPLDGRLVQHLLTDPLCDGGQWDMLVNLVNKYGVVPKSVFPECHSSGASRRMRRFLVAKLREFASELRGASEAGEGHEELRTRKGEMLETIHRILLIHFGTPPKTFDWTFRDKDGNHHAFLDQTPQGFFSEHVPFAGEMNDCVSLINDPRNPYYASFTVDRLGNVTEGQGIRYLNVPTDDLRRYAMATIGAGEPVWFGCDVGKDFHRKLSVMDTTLYDWDLVFGTAPGMSKAQRLQYGESLMTHAMVFTAFDRRGDTVTKWRVENSWGEDGADKGYYLMTDDWFEQYMYQIVVHKRVLDEALLPLLTDEPRAFPPWDPMGSLATVRGETAEEDGERV